MEDEIRNARNYYVAKDNDLIRKARYSLTVNQQKIIAYIISKIKPTDEELTRYEISIRDFCELCGIDKTYFYSEIKDIINNLDQKSFWVETPEKLFKFRWFSEVEIIKGSGTVSVLLNSNMKKYLIGLSKNYTKYELFNILGMSGKYSIRIYEFAKSYSFMSEIKVEIDKLKQILQAQNYVNFKDFRRRVLEKAINEINEYTDLEVSYDAIRDGRKVIALIFHIGRKEPLDRLESYIRTINKLDRLDGQIEGQMSIYDMIEE